jgi:hypothetical protein
MTRDELYVRLKTQRQEMRLFLAEAIVTHQDEVPHWVFDLAALLTDIEREVD